LAEACIRFGTPVTGGNVSLYNQNPRGAIDPTPTVGMIGVVGQERWITRQHFRDALDVIYLIGSVGHELGASQYLKIIHGQKAFLPPRLSYDLELGMQAVVHALIRQGLVKSAHDCSEGGFGVALAECCISGERRIGASVELGHWRERLDQILFNESQSRVIISVGPDDCAATETVCTATEIPFSRVGEVGGSELVFSAREETVRWDVAELYQAWYGSIERAMSSQ
jgi:phosphoribosylformylglycinamidine synthase